MALKLMEVMIIFLSSHLFSDLVNDICRSHYIAIEGFLDFFFVQFLKKNLNRESCFLSIFLVSDESDEEMKRALALSVEEAREPTDLDIGV